MAKDISDVYVLGFSHFSTVYAAKGIITWEQLAFDRCAPLCMQSLYATIVEKVRDGQISIRKGRRECDMFLDIYKIEWLWSFFNCGLLDWGSRETIKIKASVPKLTADGDQPGDQVLPQGVPMAISQLA